MVSVEIPADELSGDLNGQPPELLATPSRPATHRHQRWYGQLNVKGSLEHSQGTPARSTSRIRSRNLPGSNLPLTDIRHGECRILARASLAPRRTCVRIHGHKLHFFSKLQYRKLDFYPVSRSCQ